MQPYSIEPLVAEESETKRPWKNWFLAGGFCLFFLFVAAWNVVSSEWFLRTVILPRVGESINGSITVQSADWSLKHSLVLRGVTLKAEGQEPCFKAEEIQVNYDLTELINGDIHFYQARVVKPEITVHMDPQGGTNLDPFFNLPKKETGDVPLVRLDKIEVFEGSARFVRQFAGGVEERYIGSNLQLQAEGVGNGLSGGLFNLSTGLQYVVQHKDGSPKSVEGTFSLKTGIALSREWIPTELDPTAKFKIVQANGQFGFAKDLEIDLDGKIKPEHIEHLSIILTHEAKRIGAITIRGPLDLEKGSAQLEVGMVGIDRRVLNLAGSRMKLDFHSTVFNSDNQLNLTEFGKMVQVTGTIRSKPFQVSCGRVQLPPFEELHANYQAQIDLVGRRADISRFQLVARQNGQKLMEGKVVKPMVLSWAEEDIEAPDSTMKITLTDIDAADWQPWLGRFVQEGRANLSVDVVSKKAGHQIDFVLSGDGDGLKVPLPEHEIAVGKLVFKSEGRLTDYKTLSVDSLTTRLGPEVDPVLSASWPFKLDFDRKIVSGHLVASGKLPVVSAWIPKLKVNFRSGTFDCNGSLGLKFGESDEQNFEGELLLRNLTGGDGKYSVTNLTARALLKANLGGGRHLKIESFNAAADLSGETLVRQFYTAGDWDLQTGASHFGNLTLKKVDLKLLSQVVPLGALREGKADASLQINHEPGAKAKTSLTGTGSLSSGLIAGWPKRVHIDLTQLDANLLWSEKGRFKTVVKDFQLKAFNHANPKRQDAFITGSIEEYDPFTGRLNCTLKRGELTHALLQPLIAKRLGSVDLSSGKISHSKPLKINIDENGAIRISGRMTGENIVFTDSAKRLPEEALAFETGMDISCTRKGTNWNLNAATATATFTLGDQKAGRLNATSKHQSGIGEGNFKFSINDVDYRVLNFLPDSMRRGMRMNAGVVDRFESNGTISGGKITGKLGASIKGLDFNRSSWFWPSGPVDMEHSFEGTVDLSTFFGGKVSILSKKCEGSVKQNGKPVAKYDIKGSIQGNDYDFKITNVDIGPEFTARALAKWNINKRIRAGRILVGQSELVLPKVGAGSFSGDIEFMGFELESTDPTKPAMGLKTKLKIDAAGNDRIFQIENFTAIVPDTTKAANQFTLTGALDLRTLMNPVANLKLSSDALDITPFMDLLHREKSLVESESSITPNGGGLSSSAENRPTSTHTNRFSLKRLSVGLNVKRIHWCDLNATEVTGSVRVEGRKFDFLPLQMRLLGASAMVEGFIVPASGNNTRYNLNISCQNLPLNPLVHHFHPENDVEWGRLTANFHAQGDGLTGDSFKRTFTAGGIDPELPAILKIEGSHWAFKEDGFITSVIATVLRMPDLLESHFNSAELDLRVKDEKAELKFMIAGPLIKLKAEGDGEMSDRIIDTSVDEEVEVELAAKTYKYNILLAEKDGFVKLPNFITIKGPLSDPEYETDKTTITGILTGTILAVPVKLPFQLLRILPFFD